MSRFEVLRARAGAVPRRVLCAVAVALAAAGCASLPQGVSRVPSTALAASPQTDLGRIAAASTPRAEAASGAAAGLSGFRLLSWSSQALDARIELARRAQRTIDLQYYVIHDDETGRYLLRTLHDAARRGVRVRLLLDDLYTAGMDPLLLSLAATPNFELRLFNPFPAGRGSLTERFSASLFDLGRVNHRMHNKLFIADGAMAIAGGRNIGNEYFMAHGSANYIDLDAFALGAVVPQLASLFDQYWNSEFSYPVAAIVRSEQSADELQRQFLELTHPQRAPAPVPPSPGVKDLLGYPTLSEEMRSGRIRLIWAAAQAFADAPEKVLHHRSEAPPEDQTFGPTVRSSLMHELLQARKEVLVSSPYFVPDVYVMQDIREGRLWGVSITIITNSLASTDEPLVHSGYQRYRHELLDLGVALYEVAPSRVGGSENLGPFGQSIGRFHAKAAAIDREVVFIGSLNFDPRSERHNTELGLIVRSQHLAEELLSMAELVKAEAAYRVRLGADKESLEWHITSQSREQILFEEPDTGFWQRLLLRLIGPFVPDALL
ncbi:MAG: phospholipase D family protein [Burkholderiales bacterium]|nr:phospholipase D family protein [Burkholderiales bacterium]